MAVSIAPQRVVVIGGGYAGLGVIGALARASEVAVHLIDPGEAHELIPEMPEALEAHGSVAAHVVPYSELFQGTAVTHHRVQAAKLLIDQSVVETDGEGEISYDWLVLAVGTVPALPPIEGIEAALPLRNAQETGTIKKALEHAPNRRVVIVGGGLTGVEVSGVLAPDHAVTLIEAAPNILPGLGPGLVNYASRRLKRAGVQILCNQRITRIDPHRVHTADEAHPYDVLIWAGGIKPPDWLRDTGLPLDERGYPITDGWGQIVPRVFAAGDLWKVEEEGTPVPQTAQIAALAGAFVGQTILTRVRHHDPGPPFHPHMKGMLISLDPQKGVGWVLNGGIPVRGYGAHVLKDLSFQQYRLKLTTEFHRPWPNLW